MGHVPKNSETILCIDRAIQIEILTLSVWRFIICQAENIIYAGFVNLCKLDKHFGGNIIFAGFIFGIASLRHPKESCKLNLIQVCVLAQIFQSEIHSYHLAISIS